MKKTFKMKIISAAICLIILAHMFPAVVMTQALISSEAQEHITSQLRRANIPNAAVAIIHGGETTYIFRDSQHDTLFQIGSLSKSFTAFGILLLEDMGLLSVSDPVNRHLPWFEAFYRGAPVPHEDITIYNLMQHTSGLTSDERHFPSFHIEAINAIISHYTGIELAFYPGTEHQYGNINYVLLGILIEAISGQSYDEFVTQNVLHPLGLYNTFTDMQNAQETGRVVGGHKRGFFLSWSYNPHINYPLIPSGFIYSNITDMARWAGIHLGIIDISEQFARVVQRTHEDNHSHNNPFAELAGFYAGGWEIDRENGYIKHTGSTPGYFSVIKLWSMDEAAVVVIGNLGMLTITSRFVDIVIDSVVYGTFNNIGIDFFAILDIALIGFTLWSIFSLYKFIRLAIKTIKRVRCGEGVKYKVGQKGQNHLGFTNGDVVKYSGIKLKWLFDLGFAVAVILALYFILPAVMGTTLSFIITFAPVSLVAVIIFAWIELAHALFGLWVKVFVDKKSVDI